MSRIMDSKITTAFLWAIIAGIFISECIEVAPAQDTMPPNDVNAIEDIYTHRFDHAEPQNDTISIRTYPNPCGLDSVTCEDN